ncbi:glycosyltransferase, partial [Xanthomonas hyacinthi DSM 19077]
PQLYPVVAPHRVRGRLKTIALMGGGQGNRRFDWIASALSSIDTGLEEPLIVEIAGEVDPAVLVHLQAIQALDNVRLINHGHVDDEQFWKVFERADLMIALRQPTMGEASAVVCKALQAGLPVIVSDHGWYAELPPCVKKVLPDTECPGSLADLLLHMVRDSQFFSDWAEECVDQAGHPALDPFPATETYAEMLRSHCVFSDFRDRVAHAISSMKVDVESPLCSELHRIDVRATLRGDRWVDRALAALADQELDSHARIMGDAARPYPYGEALPESAFQGSAVVVEHDVGVVEPSSRICLRVELINDSQFAWLSPRDHSVRPFGIYLGHFWISSDPTTQPTEQPRHFIEETVAPSFSGIQEITVRAPDFPGDYHLEIDLVQESVCWFKNRGFAAARLFVRVRAAEA